MRGVIITNYELSITNYFDQWTDSTQSEILGAVTTGNIWQFGILYRQLQLIEQGINLYRVTEELEAVIRILLAALI